MIESNIVHFDQIYQSYMTVFNAVQTRIYNLDNDADIDNLLGFQSQLVKFDTKLRLGLAVRQIDLDESFVNRKFGELCECHLMLYKLADIWFSYETFFQLYDLTFSRNLAARKILWLDNATNLEYSGDKEIKSALKQVNKEIKRGFGNRSTRESLKEYIEYCGQSSIGGQQTRLNIISQNINVAKVLPTYSHTDILSMTYSIRNNFAHNGEVTIFPATFSYFLKNILLKLLYKYLVVITIRSANIMTDERLLI